MAAAGTLALAGLPAVSGVTHELRRVGDNIGTGRAGQMMEAAGTSGKMADATRDPRAVEVEGVPDYEGEPEEMIAHHVESEKDAANWLEEAKPRWRRFRHRRKKERKHARKERKRERKRQERQRKQMERDIAQASQQAQAPTQQFNQGSQPPPPEFNSGLQRPGIEGGPPVQQPMQPPPPAAPPQPIAQSQAPQQSQQKRAHATLKSNAVTLKHLIDAGMLEPGDSKVFILYALPHAEHTWVGALRPDGMIEWAGEEFISPSAWAIHVKRLVNPLKKADDGWKSVRYGSFTGPMLEVYKRHYESNLRRQRLGLEQRPLPDNLANPTKHKHN